MVGWDSIGSIATASYGRIDSISAATSGNMIDFASGAVIDLGNILGETVSVPIATKYQNILINITSLYTLSRECGIGVDAASVTLGEFSISKGAKNTPESTQMDFLIGQINRSIAGIGKKTDYYRTY